MERIVGCKERSPFTPGVPVPVEFFVGRRRQIEQATRLLEQAAAGRVQNAFLLGERGIGKSSFANFIKTLALKKYSMVAVHVFLNRAFTMQDMVRQVFEQIIKEASGEVWYEKIKTLFGKYITQVGLFGMSITFNPPKEELDYLVRQFPEALFKITEQVQNEKKGLFIALDDINGLAQNPDFANWYKSFVDEAATRYAIFPVFTMLVGLPERRKSMYQAQPSLARIFSIIEVEALSQQEVTDFFKRAFGSVGIKVEEDAMKFMVHFSTGLPFLMQEIGDATFWIDRDGVITRDDAMEGVVTAADIIGKKYLDVKLYRSIRSRRYLSILRKLCSKGPTRRFVKKDIEKRLTDSEKRVLSGFLRRMKQLGIIEPDPEAGIGSYRFVNEMYPVYVWLEQSKRMRR